MFVSEITGDLRIFYHSSVWGGGVFEHLSVPAV